MRELDLPYAATDHPRQRLDLYRPDRPRTDRLPVIVFVHGGGWLQGDKAEAANELMPYLEGDLGPHLGVSTAVSGVVKFYGVTEILAMIDQPSALDRRSPQAPEALLLGGPLQDRQSAAAMASPVRHVTPKAPPVITVHGTLDRIVPYDQALRLDRALTAAGVRHYLVTVNGGRHGGLPEAVHARVAAFLDRILLGRDTEISTETLEAPKSV